MGGDHPEKKMKKSVFFESLIEDFLASFLDSCFYCSTGFTVNYIRSEGV